MVELAEPVGELRRQLTVAMSEGADEAVRFELGPVEAEATVAVSRGCA
ncbi:trypco2 family protein [Streptomyces sp. NPDC053367]